MRRDASGVVYRSTCAAGRKSCAGTTKLDYPCAPEAFESLVTARLAARDQTEEDWRCAWAKGDGDGDSNVLPRGFYDCQLRAWLRAFPRRQLLALVFEEFVASRDATLKAVQSVETFLGLPPYDYASARVRAVERLYAAVRRPRGRCFLRRFAVSRRPLFLLRRRVDSLRRRGGRIVRGRVNGSWRCFVLREDGARVPTPPRRHCATPPRRHCATPPRRHGFARRRGDATVKVSRTRGRDVSSPRTSTCGRCPSQVPSRGGAYSPMLPKTKATLDELYCAPNAALAETLGRTLPWPCGDGAASPPG